MERWSDTFPRMVDMVNDVFEHFHDEIKAEAQMGRTTSPCSHEAPNEEFVESQDHSMEDIQYKKLMDNAIKPLHPSCQTKHTKLSAIVDLLSLKSTFQWSNQSFLITLCRIPPTMQRK
ncbi:hypothetical protein AAC387_Pa12g1132 [Persea americana]